MRIIEKGEAMAETQAPILDVRDNGGTFTADNGQGRAPILEVRDLEVEFSVDDGKIKVLDGVSFKVAPGQTLGIVGESGCGKSVTSLAIMGLLPRPHGQVVAGSIRFQGEELLSLQPDQMYKVRGNRISMIFQEPMTALNPVQTVGAQLMEVFSLHRPDFSKAERKEAAIAMLQKVGIPEPAQRFAVYPHNLSGGMRQRVMIAMALACEPDLLICDEPTTALDVTIQAQILDLMKALQAQTGMAIIFITHDLGVVAELCDEVVVMYAGRAVERADIFELFDHPRHPYTHGLMASIPRLEDVPKSLLKTIKGQVPALHEMPAGCRFSNRCPHATEICVGTIPVTEQLSERHAVACHHWKELSI
ncbi:Oligopeptide transport ATP-binding protein OppD [compost metagenome]